MNRLKAHLKAQIASHHVLKDASREEILEEEGSHSFVWYDYQRSKKETRSMYLVYGFLRGKSYEEMEPTTHTEPHWHSFRRLAFKHGVRKPRVRGWYPQPSDLYEGIPLEFKEHIVEKLEEMWDDPVRDQVLDVSDEEWLKLARRVYPSGEASDSLESYLQMEEWVVQALNYIRS